jgi:hypothetical protein
MWALSLVKSRVYTLKLGSGITSGIVPLADMFDHDPNKNLRWIPSADAGFIVTARAVFKSMNGIAAVREPASGIAVTDFADDLREALIKGFPCAGLHAA